MGIIGRLHVGVLALCILTGNARAQTDEAVVLEYGCRDLVAVGAIKNVSSTELSSPDDPLGKSKFSMEVSLRKVLKGIEPRRKIPATGIAHGQLREDEDFLVVLSPMAGGGYVLTSAALWHVHPRPILAKKCY